jgi:hypothetical protein
MERKMKLKKMHRGIYEYRGYKLYNCGYYHPDHCVLWEGVNIETGCADYHTKTRRDLISAIDNGYLAVLEN